jgi:hypothetical protein
MKLPLICSVMLAHIMLKFGGATALFQYLKVYWTVPNLLSFVLYLSKQNVLGPFHFCQMCCDGCDVPRQAGEIPHTDFGRRGS